MSSKGRPKGDYRSAPHDGDSMSLPGGPTVVTGSQWPRRALIGLVRGYQLFFSAWLGNRCRFAPSCSHYATGALQAHGALAGTYLAAARVLRCHPWCRGGDDPVPQQAPRFFSRITSPPKTSP